MFRRKWKRPEWNGRYRVIEGDDGYYHGQKLHAFTPERRMWTSCGVAPAPTPSEAMEGIDKVFAESYAQCYGVAST